jgi:CheY-like chemotaxis protein
MARILVVDDDSDHRRWIADVLLLEGYNVEEAGSGQEALERLAQGGVDLITLDEGMPDMSGTECYEEIRADERFRDIPVIFITILARTSKVVDLSRHGVRVLAKPLSYRDIVKAVKSALKQRRG